MSSRKSKLSRLLAFDRAWLKKHAAMQTSPLTGVIGVDEVGRGSLIGPVTAAAVVLFQPLKPKWRKALFDLDDSKAPHLNHNLRLDLSAHLKTMAWWGIGEASQMEVETLNVYYASLLAGLRAIEMLVMQFPQCQPHQHLLILDGKHRLKTWPHAQTAVIKADGLSASVAAASIIAKSHRDAWAIEASQRHPEYGWHTNAGYNTPAHRKAILEYGPTPFHRTTFKSVKAVTQLNLNLV